MATPVFVKKSRKDIYQQGKVVEYISKKGKLEGQVKKRLDRTVPASENDPIFIPKGTSYWWWAFKNGPVLYSIEKPKRSQLTMSSFLSQFYELEDSLQLFSSDSIEDVESFKDNLISDIESLKEETESSLDNMPEQLRESQSGQTLQERIDGLESWISELESIDFDFDRDAEREEIENELVKSSEEEIEERLDDIEREKAEELIEEMKQTSAGL